jgi:CubicO group peptidase (beta-lactamase class C family)
MRFVKMFRWVVLAVIVTASGLAAQTADPAAALRSNESGKRALAYLDAFNSGDTTQMWQFFDKNLSVEGKARRSVEERIGRYLQMKGQIESMALKQVDEVSDSSVVVFVTNPQDQWLQLNFMFESSAPHYMAGLGIEMLDEPPSQQDKTPLTRQQALAEINQLIDSLSAADRFSGSVLVELGGEPLVKRAVGFADIGLRVPNQLDTKFNIGSINKIFTKTAIAQLLQTERLRLDTPIGKYLIDYPNKEAASKVTLRHLIEMTGGIGDFFGEQFDNSPKNRFRSNATFIPLFAEQPLQFEPATDRRYSNGSYILLGAIIEAVTGQPYCQYVNEHIFTPSGMTNTDSYEADAIVSNLAQGYTSEDASGSVTTIRRSNIYSRPARGSAAGGGYSTAEDMLRFVTALRSGKLLDKRHTVWMFTNELPDRDPIDLQATIRNDGLGIAGGAPGINAAVERDNARGFTVIVMGNYDPPAAEGLAQKIRRLLNRVAP